MLVEFAIIITWVAVPFILGIAVLYIVARILGVEVDLW